MQSKSLILLIVTLCVFLPLAGCRDKRPERVAVSGKVLIDGKPVPHGQVFFIPPEGRPARGKIGKDGQFTLSSFGQNDGVIKGTHKVAVYANEQVNGKNIKWHAPIRYSKEQTSGLTQVIKEPTDSVVIKLTWAGGKPFVVPVAPSE